MIDISSLPYGNYSPPLIFEDTCEHQMLELLCYALGGNRPKWRKATSATIPSFLLIIHQQTLVCHRIISRKRDSFFAHPPHCSHPVAFSSRLRDTYVQNESHSVSHVPLATFRLVASRPSAHNQPATENHHTPATAEREQTIDRGLSAG